MECVERVRLHFPASVGIWSQTRLQLSGAQGRSASDHAHLHCLAFQVLEDDVEIPKRPHAGLVGAQPWKTNT